METSVWLALGILLIAAACGYLIGSLNGAIISVRLLKSEDIRQFGSHNAGLTNTLRCFGKGCGLMTLIIDLGKGAAAMALTQLLVNWMQRAALSEGIHQSFRWLSYAVAFFVVLGHVFPIWYGFHGGKGVLVGVSTFLVINPLTFLILMLIFGLVLWRSKYVSLASCIATICVVPVTFLLEFFQRGETLSAALLDTALILPTAILVIWSHRENLARLKAGTERKIGQKKNGENGQQMQNDDSGKDDNGKNET